MTETNTKGTHFHALLACEPEAKGKSEKIINEAVNTFVKKQSFFKSKHRVYKPRNEDGYQYPPEAQEMVTTVDKKLAYVQEHLIKTMDILWQKEHTNTIAKANLTIGSVVLEGVPAPALLNLENRLKEVRKLYRAIPCVPAGQNWKRDPTNFRVYVADPIETVKTKKTTVPIVLYEATEHHPAMVDKVDEDVPVGTWTSTEREGSWTPADKSEKLARIDDLIEVVKTARQEANNVPVVKGNIGKVVFDYINKGVVP